MRRSLLALLIVTWGALAHAQAPRWCFGLPCVQSPRLDFTAGRDYEHAPVFRGEPIVVPPYKKVQPLEPLSVTREFFTLSPPRLSLVPPPTIALPAALPGVVHAPIQPVMPSMQLPGMGAPSTSAAPPEPVNPNSGSFSTGVGMPSFTLPGPK